MQIHSSLYIHSYPDASEISELDIAPLTSLVSHNQIIYTLCYLPLLYWMLFFAKRSLLLPHSSS